MTAVKWCHRLAGRFISGTSIFDRGDWDVCCILDGCRVDTFRRVVGDADGYRSVASSSRQWIRRTLGDPPPGVAYVTGNPFLSAADTDALAYVHQAPVRDCGGVETVPPDALADHALAVWDHRDEVGVKRVVVHFMQPHVPFRARPDWFEAFCGTKTWGSSAWNRVADGRISRQAWFDAYRDNLRWVMADGVAPIVRGVDGAVALTADHGNAAGEWGVAGHPRGVAVPCVRRVPWRVVDGRGEDVAAGATMAGRVPDADATRDQLRALGYR